MQVRPKKYLGQHFLKDGGIAHRIADCLQFPDRVSHVIEIGPGTGVLTEILLKALGEKLVMIDIDEESVSFLRNRFPDDQERILQGDFLRMDLRTFCGVGIGIIGNFPYNISSQIFFRVFDNRDCILEVVGMVQKEVAERIAAAPGSKTYGILSVLISAFYDVEYLFTVEPEVFHPPPRVRSAVLRLTRNNTVRLDCEEGTFVKIVKLSFQKRRKTLRNALKALNLPENLRIHELMDKRAEQLSVSEFVQLTRKITI